MLDHKRKEKQGTLSLDSLTDNTTNKDGERVSQFQVLDNSTSNDLFGLMVRDERAKSVLNALASIKRAEYKKVLTLYYLEEKSYKEIAEELNVKNVEIVDNFNFVTDDSVVVKEDNGIKVALNIKITDELKQKYLTIKWKPNSKDWVFFFYTIFKINFKLM